MAHRTLMVQERHDSRYGGPTYTNRKMAITSVVEGSGDGHYGPAEKDGSYQTPEGFFGRPYVRSAPLFIHDLFDHNLWEWTEFTSLSSTTTPFAEGYDPCWLKRIVANRTCPNVPPPVHTMILTQTQTGVLQDGTRVISAVCFHCLIHITLRIQTGPHAHLCKTKNPAGGPWGVDTTITGPHMLSLKSSAVPPGPEDYRNVKYNPVIARGLYTCIAEQCGLEVVVEVSSPRLDIKWVEMIGDRERIKKQLEEQRVVDPEKFNDPAIENEWPASGFQLLMTYTKDLLTAGQEGKEPRIVSKRNKRFLATFGPRFHDLFRFLEYKEITKGEGEKEKECFLQNPPEPTKGVTQPGTRRAFFEDVSLEVRIHGHRDKFFHALSPDIDIVGESLAMKEFHHALDCHLYHPVSTNGALTYHFRFLGVMPDFHPILVEKACQRLVRFQPDLKETFEDSLYSVARDTRGHLGQNSEFLRRTKSIVGNDSDDPFNETWGLAPGNIRRTDDEITTAVRKKLRESPGTIDMVFEMLPVYINSRRSKRLGRLVEWMNEPVPMPVELAYDVLGARPDDNARQLTLNAEERIKHAKPTTIAHALKSVAGHRGSGPLSRQAEILEQGPVTSPVGLENIGNTCYLNSIIQYLYTVEPVRKLVEQYAENKLEVEDMEKRRIGGSKSKVQPVDLVIGQHFTGEALNTLFTEMTTVLRGPCAPSQALANAVLLSSEQLLRLAKEGPTPEVHAGMFPLPASATTIRPVPRTPPPLPARPTPSIRLNSPVSEGDTANESTVSPTPESGVQSCSSSPTLMGDATSEESWKVIDDSKGNAVAGPWLGPSAVTDAAGDTQMVNIHMSVDGAPDETHTAKEDVVMANDEVPALEDSHAKDAPPDTESLLQTLKVKHELTMSQQDVDEIMGRILGLLQASIKPTSTEGDIQIETIMQTFFFKVITHTVSFADGDPARRQDTRAAEFFRNLTAYPAPDGPSTLYQALDNNFDREEIEGTTTSRYSSIASLPPILHILVQRTKGDGTKNPNPVVIDEYLQLDRYMDAPEASELMYLRETSWALKKHRAVLAEHDAQLSSLDNVPLPPDDEDEDEDEDMASMSQSVIMTDTDKAQPEETPTKTASFREYAKHAIAMDGYAEDVADDGANQFIEFLAGPSTNDEAAPPTRPPNPPTPPRQTPEPSTTPPPAPAAPSATHAARERLRAELSTIHDKLEGLFAGMNSHNYALHAVVCHSGSGRGGHYWVWIRDFEAGLWRKYNDTVVSEERDTRILLDNLNSSGDPYFLCYVRDADRGVHVKVPRRDPAEWTF